MTAWSFNPRTRKGATAMAHRPFQADPVSIHAPARVRPRQTGPSGRRRVSIHAPARVRQVCFHHRLMSSWFQSTHPQGCDSKRLSGKTDLLVSIHAPARVRRWPARRRQLEHEFQSTHPQGCDLSYRRGRRAKQCFNPRTRKGATESFTDFKLHIVVSIHAPARVRPWLSLTWGLAGLFQSTHPQGCDGLRPTWWGRRPCFNPRTRKGATGRAYALLAEEMLVSIHAPARVRHRRADGPGRRRRFNPRTRKGATQFVTDDRLFDAVSIHAPARVRPTPS